MRANGRGYDAVRVWCAGIIVVGLVALAVPSALSRDRGAGETTASGGPVGSEVGASQGAVRGEATGGLGLTGDPARADGENAFAMSNSDVAESFSSLSQQQQARIMQRCRDLIAKPNQADPNQLALCQTLAAMVKH